MKDYNPKRVVVVVELIVVEPLRSTAAVLREMIFGFTCTTFLRTLN